MTVIAAAIRKLRRARAMLRREGVARTALFAIADGLWRVRLMRGGYVMLAASSGVDSACRPLPAGLTGPRDLPPAEARRIAWPREWWGTEEFVDACLARGDRCMAVSATDGVAGFQWYSDGPTRQFGASWQPAPGYLFTHAHWVAPAWRGLGLNPALTAASMRAYGGPTTRGFLCTVEYTNFPAIRSLRSSGYRPVGFVIQIGPERGGIGLGRVRGKVLRRTSGSLRAEVVASRAQCPRS